MTFYFPPNYWCREILTQTFDGKQTCFRETVPSIILMNNEAGRSWWMKFGELKNCQVPVKTISFVTDASWGVSGMYVALNSWNILLLYWWTQIFNSRNFRSFSLSFYFSKLTSFLCSAFMKQSPFQFFFYNRNNSRWFQTSEQPHFISIHEFNWPRQGTTHHNFFDQWSFKDNVYNYQLTFGQSDKKVAIQMLIWIQPFS